MKLLLDASPTAFLRNYHEVVAALEGRGHTVVITRIGHKQLEINPIPETTNNMRLTPEFCCRKDEFKVTAQLIRGLRDFALYSQPDLRIATKSRDRIRYSLENGVPADSLRLAKEAADHIAAMSHEERMRVDVILSSIEETIPPYRPLLKLLQKERPDAVLITPLVFTHYGQYELVKAARYFGIPAVYLCYSWDNLTTKGTFHLKPDLSFVWNDIQKREIESIHGIPANTVRVTGAAKFDGFFEMKPSPREEFYAAHGLSLEKPYILYLGSWSFISSDEHVVVKDVSRALAEHPVLSKCGLVMRPHPKAKDVWASKDLQEYGLDAVIASAQSNTDQLLYDCIYYSEAVIGVNTSAEIEAAIIGRPMFSIVLPVLKGSQEESVHFHYLLKENGGPKECAYSLDELCAKLAAVIQTGVAPVRDAAFLERFLRPHGIDRPVAPVFAQMLEEAIQEYILAHPPKVDLLAEQPQVVAATPEKEKKEKEKKSKKRKKGLARIWEKITIKLDAISQAAAPKKSPEA